MDLGRRSRTRFGRETGTALRDGVTKDVAAVALDSFCRISHCTGFEAIVAFSKEMVDAFTMNTTETRYPFGA